ncbi:LTA synthase family protein [Flavobacterium sp. PLA-1-15]|uniref:LTA synthase family protein n=1 Tax=Flavobacterium sp. PLA-1-15 TaxID=3380533 RepID=UPI003B7BE7FE
MYNYYSLLKLLAKRLGIVFIIYQLCRILFLAFNQDSFTNINLNTFIGGFRFDLSAISFINILFVLLHLVPGNFKYRPGYQKGLKIGFFAVNIIFIATNFVDFEYYKFTGRRSSFGLITAKGMENEIGGLLVSYLKEFWYLPLLLIGLAILLWKLFSKPHLVLPAEKLNVRDITKQSFILLFALAVTFLMARGGWQRKPLRIVDSINYASLGNSALVLNTPFTIFKTLGAKESLSDVKFYTNSELDAIFNPVVRTNPSEKPIRKNVVVVILESFGSENVQAGYTPFVDSLITQSYYFKNGFANGKVSIDAVPSTLSSIPSLMNTSMISSGYSLNEVYGLPKIFKKQGYNTSFFHGAFNGSQNFDQYCKVAGFEKYYGKNEYTPYNEADFDGRWGIFDEEFLQFFCNEISTFKQPFFTSVFTISSHQPFIMPEKHKGKFPKGTTQIHETLGYSDYALRRFFDTAKKQDWYNNTLFVFTADHTGAFGEGKYKTSIGKFMVPIFFFDPSNPGLKGVSEKNFQQIDILPSILDYLNVKDNVVSFGKSYQSDKNFVVTYLDNIYNYINNDYYLAFDGTKSIGLYDFKKDPMLKKNLLDSEKKIHSEMEQFIKAYIQSFNERVINNQLTVKP